MRTSNACSLGKSELSLQLTVTQRNVDKLRRSSVGYYVYDIVAYLTFSQFIETYVVYAFFLILGCLLRFDLKLIEIALKFLLTKFCSSNTRFLFDFR